MQILINNIRQEHIEATKCGDNERVYLKGGTHIDFMMINGQIKVHGEYYINKDTSDMTINQIEKLVEEYVKEKVLKQI